MIEDYIHIIQLFIYTFINTFKLLFAYINKLQDLKRYRTKIFVIFLKYFIIQQQIQKYTRNNMILGKEQSYFPINNIEYNKYYILTCLITYKLMNSPIDLNIKYRSILEYTQRFRLKHNTIYFMYA